MAGFAQPDKRQELEEKANIAAEQMRGSLGVARLSYGRNVAAQSTNDHTLMAIALGLDAILARLELISLSDD